VKIRAITMAFAATSALTGLAIGGGLPAEAASTTVSSSAKTHPIYLPTIANQWDTAGSNWKALQPPAPPCPEAGVLPPPFTNCGLPELPATGLPYPGNMAYWGGHVQVHPKEYLVFFGWGEHGAFSKACSKETFPEVIGRRTVNVTLKCDPDGAGKRMADFVSQIGGTAWAGVQTQYYQTLTTGTGQSYNEYITNPSNYLAGVWVDDTDPTSASITYTDMATEAARAVAHFHVTDLADSNFIIAQPQNFSDPLAQTSGYCAFHDYTEPNLEGGIYNNVPPGISYTNMSYVLNQGAGCGENLVNAGAAGTLDAFTIALGHEIEETVTDPAAEDILPGGQVIGGWFDPFDANENGDKCAYVGANPAGGVGGAPNELPGVPGEAADITGNRGSSFPVQSLWSNQAAAGVGYCAGAGTDLPAPNG
jgi:hypothetical protein